MPPFDLGFALLGAAGGFLPDMIRFAKKRHEGFPEFFQKGGYWAGLAVLVVIGAVAAWLGQADDWQSAIAMGFSAPEVFSRLFGSESAETRGSSDGFPVRRWWAR
jgi:hypothetical protein